MPRGCRLHVQERKKGQQLCVVVIAAVALCFLFFLNIFYLLISIQNILGKIKKNKAHYYIIQLKDERQLTEDKIKWPKPQSFYLQVFQGHRLVAFDSSLEE